MAEEKKLEVFPVGITEKEIKKIAYEAIAEAGGTGGTEVIANPELSGTEADLTGLQVGDTKYKIATGGGSGGGTTLYKHQVSCSVTYNGMNTNGTLYIISLSNTEVNGLSQLLFEDQTTLKMLMQIENFGSYYIMASNYQGYETILFGFLGIEESNDILLVTKISITAINGDVITAL